MRDVETMEALPADLTIAQVLEEVQRSQERQTQLDAELAELAGHRQQLEQRIDSATFPMPQMKLNLIRDQATRTKDQVEAANASASQLSNKVRQLDMAQSRLKEALARVDSVLDIKTTIALVERALASEEYAQAAKHTHRVLYRQLPVDNDTGYEVLRELEHKIRAVLTERCERAQGNKDWAAVQDNARLQPLVGLPWKGLSSYCAACRHLLSKELTSQGLTLAAQPAGAVLEHVSLLTSILDRVAGALHARMRAMQDDFGTGAHLRLLRELQGECEEQVAPLVRRFLRDRKVVTVVKQVAQQQQRLERRRQQDANGGGPDGSGSSGGGAGRPTVSILPRSNTWGATGQKDKLSSAVKEGELDPRTLDSLLEEMAYITREAEIFDLNLHKLATQAQSQLLGELAKEKASEEAVSSATKHRTRPASHRYEKLVDGMKAAGGKSGLGLMHVSKTNEVVQELVGHYISLEECYMVQNVDKAMQMDEHHGADEPLSRSGTPGLPGAGGIGGAGSSGGSSSASSNGSGADGGGRVPLFGGLSRKFRVSLTSSVVDDTFYILKKCTERAFSTCNSNSACAIVNHVNSVLGREYLGSLTRVLDAYAEKLQGGSTAAALNKLLALGQGARGRGESAEERALRADEAMVVALNNLDESQRHMKTLRAHFDREFREHFGEEESASARMVKSCLDELSNTARQFEAAQRKGATLVLRSLMPALKPRLLAFANHSYELTEQTFAECEVADPFAQQLTATLDRAFGPMRDCLTESNLNAVATALVQWVAGRVETHAMNKSFTFWGGMQFDKDVRQISGFFSAASSHPVRDKFSRLIQIAYILQLDRPAEVTDYYANQSQSWRLSEQDARRVLTLRRDFNPREVAAIQLR